MTILGQYFPRLPTQWNVTLKASAVSTIPQPIATLMSISKDGRSAVIAIEGLMNYHTGTLMARINVFTRTLTTATP